MSDAKETGRATLCAQTALFGEIGIREVRRRPDRLPIALNQKKMARKERQRREKAEERLRTRTDKVKPSPSG